MVAFVSTYQSETQGAKGEMQYWTAILKVHFMHC